MKEESYHNLCRFSDLSGFSFGYAGGAKRCSQLIDTFRAFLTFDDCGNITGYAKGVNRAGLSAGVWETVKNDGQEEPDIRGDQAGNIAEDEDRFGEDGAPRV